MNEPRESTLAGTVLKRMDVKLDDIEKLLSFIDTYPYRDGNTTLEDIELADKIERRVFELQGEVSMLRNKMLTDIHNPNSNAKERK